MTYSTALYLFCSSTEAVNRFIHSSAYLITCTFLVFSLPQLNSACLALLLHLWQLYHIAPLTSPYSFVWVSCFITTLHTFTFLTANFLKPHKNSRRFSYSYSHYHLNTHTHIHTLCYVNGETSNQNWHERMDIFSPPLRSPRKVGLSDKLLALTLLYFMNPLLCSNSYIVERQQCVYVSE